MNKTPHLIKRMIYEYEKHVVFVENLLISYAKDGNDEAAVEQLELRNQERLIGMMQLIYAMQLEEDCFNGRDFVGILHKSGAVPVSYCDRAVVDPRFPGFKGWRCHYHIVE